MSGAAGPCHLTHPRIRATQTFTGDYLWAVLIASIYEVFPLLCLLCGGQMRLIAFIIEGTVGVSTWSEGFSKGRYLASCGRNAYPFTRTSVGNGAKVKTGKRLWIKDV